MKSRQVLVRAVEAVAFLFAAFSGFLKRIAPPEEVATGFSVGTACLLALCIFLLLSSWYKKKVRARRIWLVFASTLTVFGAMAAIAYKYNLDKLTFAYPPEDPRTLYIGGTKYTREASALAERSRLSPSEVVAKLGGLPHRELVWPPASIEQARMILVVNYMLFSLSIAGAVFSLVEMKISAEGRRH